MSLEQLSNDLKTSGLPVTYRAWPFGQAPDLPYICYQTGGSHQLYADGIVYYSSETVRVELYTRLKNPVAEATVEAALYDYRWRKYPEEYISSEQCYLISYEVEV